MFLKCKLHLEPLRPENARCVFFGNRMGGRSLSVVQNPTMLVSPLSHSHPSPSLPNISPTTHSPNLSPLKALVTFALIAFSYLANYVPRRVLVFV